MRLEDSVVLRNEPQYYGTYAIFDYKRVRTHFLNEKEFKILEYIYDKSVGLKQISEKIGITEKKCEEFLNKMVNLGYVRTCNNGIQIKVPERTHIDSRLYEEFKIPFLSAPSSIDIFITSRCNLNCVHCFSNSGIKRTQELSVNTLVSLFNQLENMGVLEVRINGGEPLLHSNIYKILSILKEKRFRKVLITNGTILDQKIIDLLKESGTIPTISLDGANAEEHDTFRGVKGCFNRTIRALKLLKENNLIYGINCCMHKRNMSHYREIINLVLGFGAYRIAFLDLKESGRMKNHLDWVPSYGEYQQLLFKLLVEKFRYRGKIDVSLDVFVRCQPLNESLSDATRGYVSCQAGKTRLSIDCNGSIYPCNLVLSDSNWEMGNLQDKKLHDIWFSKKWLFFRGGVKINELKKCRNCKYLKRCRDFHCRLYPYLTNNDSLGPHPKCA